MIHLPILRHGVPYKSLDVVTVPHYQTREPFVEISQANAGLIRRDLRPERQARRGAGAGAVPFARLIAMCSEAADHFLNDTLPLGDGEQSPDDYVLQLSATTGMPHALVRRNMQRVAGVMREMRTVLGGLTRGLDLVVLDTGIGEHEGHVLSFYPRTRRARRRPAEQLAGRAFAVGAGDRAEDAAGAEAGQRRAVDAVPDRAGVHQGRLPARGVQLLPGGSRRRGRDPAPDRTEHVLRRRGGGGRWEGDPRVELHGPGYSKVLIGDDMLATPGSSTRPDRRIDRRQRRPFVRERLGRVGGRVARREVAEASRRAAGAIVPRAADDEEAGLAPFADPRVAPSASRADRRGLRDAGRARGHAANRGHGPRLAKFDGSTYLLPTVVLCDSAEHPLANREFLFPVRRGREGAAGGDGADARPRWARRSSSRR